MNIAFGSFLLPSYRAMDEGDGDVVRQWCECGTQHRDYAEGLLRAGYLEILTGYLFANRNGNPYPIGKVTEYGLWPALEKQRSRGRVYTLSVTQPRANRLSRAHRSRWYNANCVIATPELLFKKYGHVVGGAQRRAVETLAENIERHAAVELEPSAEMEPSFA